MSKVGELWGREPVLVTGLATAALNMIVGFGLSFTPEQVALVNTFLLAAASYLARSRVSPV